jgi:hypothetical protein
MKAILSAALALGLCGLVSAREDKKADPVGTWKWETKVGENKRESTLTAKKDGDKLTGTMAGRGGAETKVDDLKYKDGELTFSVTRERNDTKFTIKYKAKIEGDKIKGKAEAEFGGEKRTFEFEGKREKKDK